MSSTNNTKRKLRTHNLPWNGALTVHSMKPSSSDELRPVTRIPPGCCWWLCRRNTASAIEWILNNERWYSCNISKWRRRNAAKTFSCFEIFGVTGLKWWDNFSRSRVQQIGLRLGIENRRWATKELSALSCSWKCWGKRLYFLPRTRQQLRRSNRNPTTKWSV